MAICPVAFPVLATPDIVKVPLQVSGHDQIQQSISIQIDPRRAGRPPAATDAGLFRYISKCAVSIVMVKPVSAIGGYVQIFKPIIVIVSDGNSHAVTASLQPGPRSYIFKCAIVLLVIKAIPLPGAALLRNRPLRRGITERSSIHYENIQASIVVIIKQGHARSHRLNQVFPGRVRSDVFKIQTERQCYIGELCPFPRRRN